MKRTPSRQESALLRNLGPYLGRWKLILLVAVLGLQLFVLADSYILPTASQVWEIRGSPAWERTSLILGDRRFAGHIGFLRQAIPDDARVILPPLTRHSFYEHIGFMQYSLFPRDIHNCGRSESPGRCVSRMRGEGVYIIGLDDFPPRDVALEFLDFKRFRDDLGVFVPRQ